MNKKATIKIREYILIILVSIMFVFLIVDVFGNNKSIISFNITQINISTGTLENMLMPIVKNTTISQGDCLSYAIYYQSEIKKVYPELDIRKIDLAGICPIGTKECGIDEGMPHTYLIINGHGGECILDQDKLICIQVRDE